MRISEFHTCVEHEFGQTHGKWLVDSHVLLGSGRTAGEMLQDGTDPRVVWLMLCDDFDVPESRRLGPDPNPDER